jgi:hypothetical protein
VSRRHAIFGDIWWSLKWTSILILPLGVVIAGLVTVLGGLEGAGKLIFLAALAPMLLLDPVTKGLDGPLAWATFVVAEFAYVFLLVFVARLLWRQNTSTKTN